MNEKEMLDMISQILIPILGLGSIMLYNSKTDLIRFAPIIGIIAQPFWLWTMYENKHWGMFIFSCLITLSYIIGIYNYWFNKQTKL